MVQVKALCFMHEYVRKPTKGSVEIDGVDYKVSPNELKEYRKKIGMIFQHFNLLLQEVSEECSFPENSRIIKSNRF